MKRFWHLAIVAVFLSLSACAGGGDGDQIMPAVESKRLDVAQSDLKKAGVDEGDVEVIGGGAFGVIDESNWNVCAQEPGPGKALTGKIRLTVDRSCDDGDSLGSTEGSKETSAAPVAPTEEAPAERFKMPQLVGQNLQDAQDRLQTLGSFVIQQDDDTGLERFQVLDSNWKVCSQKPRAGKTIPTSDLVTLGAVKLDENCP